MKEATGSQEIGNEKKKRREGRGHGKWLVSAQAVSARCRPQNQNTIYQSFIPSTWKFMRPFKSSQSFTLLLSDILST